MAQIEHGLQMSFKRYALSMEHKIAAGAFGRATNYIYLCKNSTNGITSSTTALNGWVVPLRTLGFADLWGVKM